MYFHDLFPPFFSRESKEGKDSVFWGILLRFWCNTQRVQFILSMREDSEKMMVVRGKNAWIWFFGLLFFKLPHLQPAFLIPQLIPVSDGAVVQQCLHVVGPVSVAQANKVWIRQVILPQSKVGRRNTRDEFDNWHEFAPAKFPKIAKIV